MSLRDQFIEDFFGLGVLDGFINDTAGHLENAPRAWWEGPGTDLSSNKKNECGWSNAINHPWLGIVYIPPIGMVMTGGWFTHQGFTDVHSPKTHDLHPCGNSPAHMDTCILYARNGGPPCTTEMEHLQNANMGCIRVLGPLKNHGPGNQLQKNTRHTKQIQIQHQIIKK